MSYPNRPKVCLGCYNGCHASHPQKTECQCPCSTEPRPVPPKVATREQWEAYEREEEMWGARLRSVERRER